MAHFVTNSVIFFLIFMALASTFKAQDTKQCEYEMIVNTGPTGGPTSKIRVTLEAIGGENINTTNVIKNWGAMGGKYTYFLPNSSDRFRTNLPCMEANFCWIAFRGKKGTINPPWYINNVTVSTKGQGINRFKTFRFTFDNEVETLYPDASDGECP